MAQFSASLLHSFLPGIDNFNEAHIEDVVTGFPDHQYWMANHFLNTSFGARYTGTTAPLALNIIYRAEAFFRGYEKSRELTAQFLSNRKPGQPGLRAYLEALRGWEGVLLDCQIACDLIRSLGGENVFGKGDGSVEERAYLIANQVKHCASSITGGTHPAPLTVPMWLTNDGFRTATTSLSFVELAELARELGKSAEMLKDPSPKETGQPV